jgi:hypothetical protein
VDGLIVLFGLGFAVAALTEVVCLRRVLPPPPVVAAPAAGARALLFARAGPSSDGGRTSTNHERFSATLRLTFEIKKTGIDMKSKLLTPILSGCFLTALSLLFSAPFGRALWGR